MMIASRLEQVLCQRLQERSADNSPQRHAAAARIRRDANRRARTIDGSSEGLLPMPPALAYGRHRGPARRGARQAAVAVSLFLDSTDQWTIPLTRRPATLRHHGGQICLPGGKVEPGEGVEQAALREFEEELGVRPNVRSRCGTLRKQYVYASGNEVQPVVFVIEQPQMPWQPDPAEVDEVILLPLNVLFMPEKRSILVRKRQVRFQAATESEQGSILTDTLQFPAPAFEYQGFRIWGATAMILDELAQILLQESL